MQWKSKRWSSTLRRWIVFNLVGVTGMSVQLATLTWLLISGLDYLVATALAVEVAVLNNFVWHERWTWQDRSGGSPVEIIGRLARFNLTVGVISIVQNVVFMKLLVGHFSLHYIPGNLISVALCALLNFLVSDRLVFRRREPVYVAQGTQ